ncbi:hypothetical protein D3C76_1594350 [compost metagenome]
MPWPRSQSRCTVSSRITSTWAGGVLPLPMEPRMSKWAMLTNSLLSAVPLLAGTPASPCSTSIQPAGKCSACSMRRATSSPRFFSVRVERIWLRCAGLMPQRSAQLALRWVPINCSRLLLRIA